VSQEVELIDIKGKLFTGEPIPSKVCVKCLLCGNVLETYMSLAYDRYPYVCDECKEAIAYAKELKKRNSCRL
jgi:hypothetical protein